MDIFQGILQNIFLRAHFLQCSTGQLLLTFRKLDIQNFNSKQIFSLDQYYWHTMFDHE